MDTLLPPKNLVAKVLDRDVKELPAFPVVALQILDLIRKQGTSSADVAKVVESDPSVTVKVLRLVNSAAYGFRGNIASVKDAITMLGFSTIQKLTLQVTLFEQIVRPQKAVIFDRTFFWQHCLSVAGLSIALAEETGYPRPQEAYVAGLIHDIGKTILDGYGRISYGDFLNNLVEPDSLKVEAEKNVIGISHDDIGAYFCHTWNLPEDLIHTVKFHHQRFSRTALSKEDALLVSIVSFSNFIAWTQGLGSTDILRQPILQPEVMDVINVKSIDFKTMLSRMDQEIKRTAELYQFSFPSPDEFRMNLLRANIELSRLNTRFYYKTDPLKQKEGALQKALEGAHPKQPVLSPKAIINNTIKAIQNDFSFDRLYIFRVNRRHRCLVPVKVLDIQGNITDFSKLTISISPQSGEIVTCLRSLKPGIIQGRTPEDKKLLQLLEVAEMGFVPFSHNNRLLGVLGVDNHHCGQPLALADLRVVSSVVQEIGVALDQLMVLKMNKSKEHLDLLTKLYHRDYVEKRITTLLDSSGGPSDAFFVAMIGIDRFSDFNDRFGFHESDSIVKLIAGLLKKHTRPTDDLGRFDTDKFFVLLNSRQGDNADNYAERTRRKIEELGIFLIKRFPGHAVTVSIGLAESHARLKTKDAIIGLANSALDTARKQGGNKTVRL